MGTLEDWKQLLDQIKGLRIYGLNWWTDEMEAIFEKIIDTYNGKVDNEFWKFIFK